jgi:CheY-like chemotaxis protein
MVFGFIKQSGGHINVYSEPDAGTTFRLYLPRDQGTVPAAVDVAEAASALGAGETVLVVEDNPALRRVVVSQLRRLGYRVLEAENVASALAILEGAQRVDLVFADVVMPGKADGYDLARIVAARWPTINVLLTSGFPGNHRDAEAATIPLLTKPYRREDLARAVRDALSAPRNAAEPEDG